MPSHHISSHNLPYEKVGKNEPVCIADEVPFEIPDSWEWVRLGDVFQHNTGKALNSSNQSGNLMKYITTSNLYWNRFELDSLREMRFTESEVEKCTVLKGDLLVCEGGDIGRAAIWSYDYSMRIQNHIHRLRAYSEVCTDFYYYLFFLYKNVGWIGGKGIGIQGLSSNVLHNLLFPLPPLAEQKRIVQAIITLKPYTDRYEDSSKKLKELNASFPDLLKKSILQQAVMGKLVPQDPNDEPASVLLEKIRAEKDALIKAGKLKKDKHESIIYRRDNSHYEKIDNVERCIDEEIPFDIPDNWIWTRFDTSTLYTTDYVANGSFASLRENVKTYKEPNYAIMIKTQDFANGFNHDLTYTDKAGFEFLSKSELHGGELMLSNIGASIGKAFIIPVLDRPMTLAPNSIVVKCINETMTLFIKYLMLSFYGQQVLKDFTAGTAMPKFSKTQLRHTLIPLPPVEEQKRILIQIELLFSYVDTL